MAMEAITRELAVRGVEAVRWDAWTVQAVENVLAREGRAIAFEFCRTGQGGV